MGSPHLSFGPPASSLRAQNGEAICLGMIAFPDSTTRKLHDSWRWRLEEAERPYDTTMREMRNHGPNTCAS